MAGSLSAEFKSIHAKLDLLAADMLKLASEVSAARQLVEQQAAYREQVIGSNERRGTAATPFKRHR